MPLLVALLVGVSLAGCTTTDPDRGGVDADEHRMPGPDPRRPASSFGLLPPEWDPFDAWTYRSSTGTEATFVIVGDSPTDFVMAITDPDTAFFDARTDVSTLGPIRKPDLAGSQGDDWVKFFDWPMRGGMAWTTMWDGAERSMSSSNVSETVFAFEAVNEDGTTHATYVYDHDIMWFTELLFLTPDGSEAFAWRFIDRQENFTGTVVSWDLDEIMAVQADGGSPLLGRSFTDRFTVAEGFDEVWAEIVVSCTTGSWLFELGPAGPSAPDHNTLLHGACPLDGNTETIELTATPGEWVYSYDFAMDEAASVTVETLLRTRVDTDVAPT